MKFNSFWVIIFYRLLFILICLTGVVLGLLEKTEGVFMGDGTAINFYTLQSNIWALILEIFLLFYAIISHFKAKRNSHGYITEESENIWNIGVFKFIFTVSIMLTFLVYWFMLAPFINIKEVIKPSNLLLHAFSPILMLLDFIFFDREYVFRKNAILLTLIPSICYFIFILVKAEISPSVLTLGSRYPYWFMDVDAFRLDWK